MKSRSSASAKASPAAHDRSPVARHRDRAKRLDSPVDDPGQKKRNTHRRSSEILEAAAKVFAERGYHGATTQDIADVLGIRQASLYYYFPSKEMALEIVCARSAEGFLKSAQAVAAGPGTPTDKLSALIRGHISPILDRSDYIKVFLTQRHFLPTVSRQRVGKWSRAIEKIFETAIKDGIRSGEFRSDLDPRLTMLAILGMANGVPAWYRKENVSIERIGSEFIRFVLNGVAAHNGRAPAAKKRR